MPATPSNRDDEYRDPSEPSPAARQQKLYRHRAKRGVKRVSWSLKVPSDLAAAIDALAEMGGQTRSEYVIDLMTLAADKGMVKEEEQRPTPRFRETK